jgi:hypothetical protein
MNSQSKPSVDCISCVSLEHDPNGTRCSNCCIFHQSHEETEGGGGIFCRHWLFENLSVTKEQYETVMAEKERCKISGEKFDPEEYLQKIKKSVIWY